MTPGEALVPGPRLPRWLFASLVTMLLLVGSARADVIVGDSLGHGGRWVSGAATPYEVELRNNGSEPVEVRLSVDTKTLLGGGQGLRHERTVVLGPGVERREPFLISGPAQGARRRLVVAVEPVVPIHYGESSANRGRMEITPQEDLSDRAIVPPRRVIATLGDERGALRAALRLHDDAAYDEYAAWELRPDFVRAATLEVSPYATQLAPLGLDGIDTLVVLDPDATFPADAGELERVLDWVALGGRLVLSLGNRSAAFAASPLTPVLPAGWTSAEPDDYLDVARELSMTGAMTPPPARAARGPWSHLTPRTDVEGLRVRRRPDGAPYAVERRFGRGSLVVVACDLSVLLRGLQHPEVSRGTVDWLAPPQVEPPKPNVVPDFSGHARFLPYDTLRAALQKGAVEPPPVPLVILALALYVLVVGPVDWLVLRKLGKQRLTTLTFTASVVGFTAIAYLVSLLIFAEDALTNRVVLIDLAEAPGTGREVMKVTDVAGHYEPTGGTRELRHSMPAHVVASDFPGHGASADSGSSSDVRLVGNLPLQPVGEVDIAFRSQAIVRTILVGTPARTVEIEQEGGELRLVNGLDSPLSYACLLTRTGGVTALRSVEDVEAGATVPLGAARPGARLPGANVVHGLSGSASDTRQVLLAGSTLALQYDAQQQAWGNAPPRETLAALHDAGFDLSHLLLPPSPPGSINPEPQDRGLLLVLTERVPIPLPGGEIGGAEYVLIRKEVELE